MTKSNFFTILGAFVSVLGLNMAFLGLYWADLQEDVDRLEDRVEFLTKIVLRGKYDEMD